MKRQKWWAAMGILGIMLCLAGRAQALPPWPYDWPLAPGTMKDLGVIKQIPGTDLGVSWANGINDRGWVVGEAGTYYVADNGEIWGINHAFLWTPERGMQDLGFPPDVKPPTTGGNFGSWAAAINNAGQIVVNYWQGDYYKAYVYDAVGGAWTKLATQDNNVSTGRAINEAGQVAGMAFLNPPLGTGNWQACLWDSPSSALLPLGTLIGTGTEAARSSTARGINTLGWVVGESRTKTDTIHAFLWKPGGRLQDLGVFPGQPADYSYAKGINDGGFVVGWGPTDDTGKDHALLWGSDKAIRDLGYFPGGWASQAHAINNHGQVTGQARGGGDINHPFLWTPGGMKDLGSIDRPAPWGWSNGLCINNRGQIGGEGARKGQGGQHAFLWTPGAGISPGMLLELLLR